jgi:ribosomal-protein-alanine N-acetyltransferase
MTDEPFEPIDTTRLLIRCVRPEDAMSTATMMTPDVSRWVAYWPVPFTVEMAATRIETARRAAFAGNSLPCAVIAKRNAAVVGWVMLDRDRQRPRHASLGYWFGEQHHGLGYMREVALVILRAGFRLLDLDVIEAAAQPENAASLAVMRACGMTPTGQRMVYAPARGREELCLFHEISRDLLDEGG